MARIENEEEEDSIHCATRSWARFQTPPLKRVCSLISYRLVSAMRHMVDQSLPELLAYSAKLCIELLLFRTYIQLYTHIYTYQYRYIQIYMYAVGSRCCWMATSFARGWRFGQRFLARSVLFGLLVCLFAAWQRVIDAEPTMIIIIVVKLIIINLIQSLLLLLSWARSIDRFA